jgi:hypothetical protein
MKDFINISNVVFDVKLKKALIDGGQIIYSRFGRFEVTFLIRLPKDKYYKEEIREFEYLLFQLLDGITTYHAISFNGSKKEVIKKVNNEHVESEFDQRRAWELKHEE